MISLHLKLALWVEEMAQPLGALVALPEDQNSVLASTWWLIAIQTIYLIQGNLTSDYLLMCIYTYMQPKTLVRCNKYLLKKERKKRNVKVVLQDVVVHNFNPSTGEAESGGSLKASQVYIVRPCHCPTPPISPPKYSIPSGFTMCSSNWGIILNVSLVRQRTLLTW